MELQEKALVPSTEFRSGEKNNTQFLGQNSHSVHDIAHVNYPRKRRIVVLIGLTQVLVAK